MLRFNISLKIDTNEKTLLRKREQIRQCLEVIQVSQIKTKECLQTRQHLLYYLIDNQATSWSMDGSLDSIQQHQTTGLTSLATKTNKSILTQCRSTVRLEIDLAPFGNNDIARELPQVTTRQKSGRMSEEKKSSAPPAGGPFKNKWNHHKKRHGNRLPVV
jgi:hypothetical protein